MQTFSKLFLVAIVFCVVSCAPRGETKSLDEVLDNSRMLYRSHHLDSINQDLSARINGATGAVEKSIAALSDREQLVLTLAGISADLAMLTTHAGVTSRPAMSELATQYRELAAVDGDQPITEGQVKLLGARTYLLLSSELSTTRFSL